VCRASITVALVEYSSPTGRLHRGAASGTIHGQQVRCCCCGASYLLSVPLRVGHSILCFTVMQLLL
jgi:hypothetical protein